MSDRYVEYSRQGWFGRIGNAIKEVLFGVVLMVVSLGLLFWNEGRAVHRAQALNEGAASVVTVDARSVKPATDGKLVHFTGDAAGETLADPEFGVSRDAIHLRRVVEMYQYKEQKKERKVRDAVGGGERTETTYDYLPVWSAKLIRQSEYENRDARTNPGLANPPDMPAENREWHANVTVGAFTLPAELAEEINNDQPIPLDESAPAGASAEWQSASVRSGVLYRAYRPGGSVDPQNPKVGDVRVSFKFVPPGPVSVMARQTGTTLSPYRAKAGTLFILYTGTHSAADLIKMEQTRNTILTWVLRLVGFVVLWIALAIALNPLKVLADVVGIIGDIAGVGIFLVSGVVAFTLSAATVAVAWLVYRPLLGVGMLVIAAAGFAYAMQLRKKGATRRAASFPTVLPPIPPIPHPAAQPSHVPLPPLPK